MFTISLSFFDDGVRNVQRLLLFYLLILRGGSRLPNLCILVCQALIKWRGVEVTVALEVTLYYDYMVTRFILDILRGDENDNMLLPMLCNLFISHRDITFYIARINNILCFYCFAVCHSRDIPLFTMRMNTLYRHPILVFRMEGVLDVTPTL